MKEKNSRPMILFSTVLVAVLLVGTIVLLCIDTTKPASNQTDSEQLQEEINKKEIDRSRIVNEEVPSCEETDNKGNIESQIGEAAQWEGKYGEVLANPEQMMKEGIYAKEAANTDEVVLMFAGDICFDENYSNMYYLSQRGGDISKCFSESLYEEMINADIFMVNNEFTYTVRGEPIPEKAYTFRSNPENIKLLETMGVDIVSLANNHAYDYGEISLLDSLDTLENSGMPYVGAGRNFEEAKKPVYFISNDIKIAIVSASQIERQDNPDTKGATENSPGVFRCWGNGLEDLLETIKEAKANSDFVVVYIHWGTENTDELDWAQTYQAPRIAEAGANVIIGGHTHCLQGIDITKDVPVIYSIGNFWFNSKNLDAGIVKLTVNKQGLKSFQFLPVKTQSCFTSFAEGEEKTAILEYMRSISTNVSMDEEGIVSW
ncbi:MAG: CapA family protein [Lachnospiraceae bacterium]|nr:CapA family protein [Lachnospiraceae bacterium]